MRSCGASWSLRPVHNCVWSITPIYEHAVIRHDQLWAILPRRNGSSGIMRWCFPAYDNRIKAWAQKDICTIPVVRRSFRGEDSKNQLLNQITLIIAIISASYSFLFYYSHLSAAAGMEVEVEVATSFAPRLPPSHLPFLLNWWKPRLGCTCACWNGRMHGIRAWVQHGGRGGRCSRWRWW